MKRWYKSVVLYPLTLFTTCSTFVATANAQVIPTPTSSSQLEEVTVTAQRRSQNLQNTPVAVTALNATDLRNRGVYTTKDLQGSIPNLQLADATASPSSVNISLRGAYDVTPALETDEPPVGLYIDDVYHPRLSGSNFEFPDIERIEVLRGPQGTLYGRNTLAGAVKIYTKRPTDDIYGSIDVGGGSFGTISSKGDIGGPLIAGLLGGSAAFVSYNTDGYQFNRATNLDIGHQHDFSGHASLNLFGLDNFKAFLTGYMVSNKDDGYIAVPLKFPPGVQSSDLGRATFASGDQDTTESPIPSAGNNQQWGVSLNMAYTLPFGELRSITGYADERDLYAADFDGGQQVGPDAYQIGFYRRSQAVDKTISEELQLSGKAFNDRLNWITGVYYDHNTGQEFIADQLAFTPTFVATLLPTFFELTTDSFAAYAQASYKILDNLTFTAGLRESNDDKKFNALMQNGFVPPYQYAIVHVHKGFHTITPHFGLDYQVEPNILTYISISEGFQSGGFNGLAVANPEILSEPYNDETVWSYEAGVKSDFFDRRVRINAAFFYAIYYGLQENAIIDPATLSVAVQNVGTAQIHGLELETSAVITEGLKSSFTLGLQEDSYEGLSPGSIAAQSNARELPLTPNYNGQVALDYFRPLGEEGHFALLGGTSFNFRGGYRADASDLTRSPADYTWNAYIGGRGLDDHLELRLTAKNLTNHRVLTCCTITTPAGIVTLPRTVLAELKYTY